MRIYSKTALLYGIATLSLCPSMLLKADDLDEVPVVQQTQPESAARHAKQRSKAALSCFERTKARGTVWLRTQGLVNELNALMDMPHSAEKPAKVIALSDTIVEHCGLIQNQHALERARYLLTTIETGQFEEASVEAVRDMLIAADGPAALRLIEDLIEHKSVERPSN